MNERARPTAFAAAKQPAQVENAPAAAKIAVLLINLGTPDDTSYWPMRRYLKEFLSDRRVIETNRVLWWLILNGVVLVKRPFASGAKYRSIWNEELDEFAASHHHRGARPRKWQRARFVARQSSSTGRCATASPSIALAHRRACGARLRPAARLPALSAICRGDHGDRERQGLRGAEGAPGAAGAAHRAALSRPIPSISRRWRTDQDASRRSRFRARGDPRLVPRPAAVLCRPGRSLSGPCAGHDRGAARERSARSG